MNHDVKEEMAVSSPTAFCDDNATALVVNKLAMELTQARRWLLSVRENSRAFTQEEKAQYEFTLLWVQLQQKVLDELEGFD